MLQQETSSEDESKKTPHSKIVISELKPTPSPSTFKIYFIAYIG